MKKINKLGLLFLVGIFCVHADDQSATSHQGYVSSVYGNVIRNAYGNCVHTVYFDKDTDGLDECDEGKPKKVEVVKPVITYEVVKLSDADTVLFEFNRSDLTTNGKNVLTDVINKITNESDVTHVEIDGYTDSIGSEKDNLTLSINRADTVKGFFISNGYPSSKINSQGFGEKDAVASKECVAKLGDDPYFQMMALNKKLESKKYKSRNKKIQASKRKLQAQLNKLTEKRNSLIQCMASDRRVVFTIEHTARVATKPTSSVPVNMGTPNLQVPDKVSSSQSI